ncbi:hypothetical protein ABZ611_29085 [Streptomyces sp. NPDC007861]|uniref:hypothetical protein n=1 Tax=Streptomyces sp. NPDC007861 TaxID=3154893 RepID=UPI0033ECB649
MQQQHETRTTERGSFSIASCTCGWCGPARRSRERARVDAQLHRSRPETGLLTTPGGVTVTRRG